MHSNQWSIHLHLYHTWQVVFLVAEVFVCLGDILFVSTVFLEKSYRFEWFHFVLEKTFQLKREQQDCEVRKKVGEFLGSK